MKALYWLDENFEKYLCMILFCFFAVFMVLNVFLRFIFHKAIPWASEFCLFISTWFITIAMSYGFRKGAHVQVTFVLGLFSAKAQKILGLISNLLIMFFFIYISINAVRLLGDKSIVGKTGILVKYPMWALYSALPAGTILSTIRIVQNFRKQTQKITN